MGMNIFSPIQFIHERFGGHQNSLSENVFKVKHRTQLVDRSYDARFFSQWLPLRPFFCKQYLLCTNYFRKLHDSSPWLQNNNGLPQISLLSKLEDRERITLACLLCYNQSQVDKKNKKTKQKSLSVCPKIHLLSSYVVESLNICFFFNIQYLV